MEDYLRAVQEDMPVRYFETKFNRPIYLNEFESAIVPDNTPQEVVDALEQQGLNVSTYKAGDDADRMRVVREQASEETRFSVDEGEGEKRLSESEADTLLSQMEEHAEVAPVLELTPENWEKEFGKENRVNTPIGEVKLGENQYAKLIKNKRNFYFGMIKPTLERPDVILEEYDPKEGAERDTKYLFVKTFTKPDGGRIVHFESVTIKKEGLEVSISSHELDGDRVKAKVQNDNILHLSKELPFSSEWRLTEAPQREGPDLVPTSDNSNAKGSNISETAKGNGEKNTRSEREQAGEQIGEKGIDIGNGLRMSVSENKEDNTLHVSHSLSRQNLWKVVKAGCLVNPSLAVSDITQRI